MKILFVCWYFPPSNTIAAVRLGKLAKYLLKAGHDVHVLTAKDPPYAATLPVEIPAERIHRSDWWDINSAPVLLKRLLRRLSSGVSAETAAEVVRQARKSEQSGPRPPEQRQSSYGGRLSALYQRLFNIPDGQIGWTLAARREGLALFKNWQPDAIFASGPPFTTLLIGVLLNRTSGIPLIVELRDRWSDDPYYPPRPWRRKFERWLEKKVLGQATALTTVSEPWAETYRKKYGKPVAVIYNGYDPVDVPSNVTEGWPDPHVLRILHTGGIYRGRRDPTPLFQALKRNPDLRSRVRVVFFGLSTQFIPSLAREQGVEDCVEVYQRVEHAEAVRQQYCSDVLLLMQHDNPQEQGNVPGKFFEYLGALRPILVLGYREGVPATIVKQRAAGFATTDPEEIECCLRQWIDQKEQLGKIPSLPPEARAGFTHEEQAKKLAAFLEETVFTLKK